MLSQIDRDNFPYAIRILRWLTSASRPLYLSKVAEVAARDPDLSICSGLVTVTHADRNEAVIIGSFHDYSGTVALAHFSVKKYLVSKRMSEGQTKRLSFNSTLCH
jgi:hypothetical protein